VDRVVIVGGGFAGLAAARRLGADPVEVEVVVVDQHNFHTFQPLLYQVATAGLDPADVAYPIRTVLRRTRHVRFVHGRVSGFDLSARSVLLEDGQELPYDHLIVASGATAATFGVPGVVEHALFLYTLDDARWVRNQVLAALESADAAAPEETLAPVIVVVGGGPTGVETAGAMAELIDIAIRHDRLRLDPDRTRVVLLDAQERLLPGFSAAASAYAERILRARGVEVRLGLGVEAVSAAGVTLAGGELVTASVVIWAAGVTVDGTVAAGLMGRRGPGGRVVVERDLSLPDHPEVFVVGDAAAVPGPDGPALGEGHLEPDGTRRFLPQLAQVAIQSGDHAAHQVVCRLESRPTTSFAYRDKGVMATIGRRSAVAQLANGTVFCGTIGWIAWLALHLVYLIGFRNRMVVLINWAWHYFRWPSGPRLIIGDVPARPPAEPRPGRIGRPECDG
jgi:NADH dehydrogenase